MKKILSGTPIPAFVIFILFCIWFEILTSTYQVDVYQEYKIEILESNIEKNFLILKMKESSLAEGQKVKFVYSDQNPALRGVISEIKDDRVRIRFENLSCVSEKELKKANFEFAVGTKAIGEDLNIWK